ncbi:MAG: hypothetical protein AAGA66_19250 [Bacteroidota bacterium]
MLDHKKLYLEIQPALEKEDETRLKYYRQVEPFKYTFWSVFILGGSYQLYLLNFSTHQTLSYTISYVLLSTASFVLLLFKKQSATKYYKKVFYRKSAPWLIKSMGSSFEINTDDHSLREEIQSGQLLTKPEDDHCENRITGLLHDHPIYIMEFSSNKVVKNSFSAFQNPYRSLFIVVKPTIMLPLHVWCLSGGASTTHLSAKREIQPEEDHLLYRAFVDPGYDVNDFPPGLWKAIQALYRKYGRNRFAEKGRNIRIHLSPVSIELDLPTRKKLISPQLNTSCDSLGFVQKQAALLDPISDFLMDLSLVESK